MVSPLAESRLWQLGSHVRVRFPHGGDDVLECLPRVLQLLELNVECRNGNQGLLIPLLSLMILSTLCTGNSQRLDKSNVSDSTRGDQHVVPSGFGIHFLSQMMTLYTNESLIQFTLTLRTFRLLISTWHQHAFPPKLSLQSS